MPCLGEKRTSTFPKTACSIEMKIHPDKAEDRLHSLHEIFRTEIALPETSPYEPKEVPGKHITGDFDTRHEGKVHRRACRVFNFSPFSAYLAYSGVN